MSQFSPTEISLIQEFRSRIADALPFQSKDQFIRRDDSLMRWLQARDMDLDKAEEMFRNSMKWRIENDIDELLTRGMDPDVKEKFPYYLDGLDKMGRPVVTIPYGEWDVRTFVEEEGSDRFISYFNHLLENVVALMKKCTNSSENEGKQLGPFGIQFVMICDMAGYTYRQLANMKAVQSILQTVSIYEAHYPETLGQSIVINAPSVFSILFGMMKQFMSGRTVEKIQVYPEEPEKWKPVILEIVDPSQIRERFGGTKE